MNANRAIIKRSYDIVKTPQDLSYLSWDEHDRPSGLSGSRMKAREGSGAHAVFYKGAHRGTLGSQGRGCMAELVCSRLYDALSIEHAPTQLVLCEANDRLPRHWLIRSKSYRKPGEQAIPLDLLWSMQRLPEETPLSFCVRMGWGPNVAKIMLADYLTATRSRDASCFEALRDRDGVWRLAPIIPRALSLTNSFPADVWRESPLADMSTENYLGSSSLVKNLEFASRYVKLKPLSPSLKRTLLHGLDDIAPDDGFLEGCWAIVSRRWAFYESLRDL